MLKQISSFILAGIIGGLIVLGGLQLLENNANIEDNSSTVQLANNNEQPTSTAVAYPFDFKAAAKIATPSVVNIEARQTVKPSRNDSKSERPFDFFFGNPFDDYLGPKAGTGSGVIYTADGYIITNNHVVDFADEIVVTLHDNRQYEATVVGTYPEADLAVLRIEADGLPTLELANSDVAEIGEWVLAVGNPFNLTSTVTAGIISAKGRSMGAISARQTNAIESFIQTDAAVNPGNSGGALVDAEGKLLGINTAIATRTGTFAGYSFAIPVNLMKRIVEDIIENGSYERGLLGVRVFEVNSEYAEEEGLNFTQGVVIDEIVEDGAAEAAGVYPKDIIVEIDNKTINSFPELQEAVSSMRVGEVVNLKVYRDGRYKEIPVRLKGD